MATVSFRLQIDKLRLFLQCNQAEVRRAMKRIDDIPFTIKALSERVFSSQLPPTHSLRYIDPRGNYIDLVNQYAMKLKALTALRFGCNNRPSGDSSRQVKLPRFWLRDNDNGNGRRDLENVYWFVPRNLEYVVWAIDHGIFDIISKLKSLPHVPTYTAEEVARFFGRFIELPPESNQVTSLRTHYRFRVPSQAPPPPPPPPSKLL